MKARSTLICANTSHLMKAIACLTSVSTRKFKRSSTAFIASAKSIGADVVALLDPYLARPDPERAPRYSDYIHLARLEEWGGGGNE